MNRFVLIPAGDVYVQISATEPALPWLILSNSLAATTLMWGPQLAALQTRYRVLRYDTRGHGSTSAPHQVFNVSDLSQDVVDLADALDIARFSFLGLSLGGIVGLGLAVNHPERLDRLVCCDARADAPADYVQAWSGRIAAVADGGMEAVVDETLQRWLSEATRQSRPAIEVLARHMILQTTSVGYRYCAHALTRLNYLPRLEEICIPTLYVVGAQDTGTSPMVMQAMAERTPGALLMTVPDSAHICNLDNPEGFHAATASFLGLPT